MIRVGRGTIATAITAGGLLTAALAAAAGTAPAALDEWPQFRGPERSGVSRSTGVLATWPAEGPRQSWRRPIGEGFSGIVAGGGRLYTMYAGDHEGKSTELATALDPASGQEVWRTPVAERYDTQ